MKILMLSKSGDGLGLAHYMKIKGHEVFLWIKEAKDFEYAGLGMFEKISNWRTRLADVDLVLSDMVGLGSYEEEIRKSGKPYLGISKNADDLELDRAGQMEIMQRLKINLPKTISFDSPRAAEAVLDYWKPPGYVIKPSGNLDTGKTYVCRDELTYSWALKTFSGSQQLVIQEIVEGIEVSTEGWFDGRDFIDGYWNHTFEEKRFLPDNLGPNTGCMGNVVIQADKGSKLVEVVKRFAPVLRNLRYKGPFDLNTIVNEDGIFALEVTPRFGYDAIEAFLAMVHNDFTEELGRFATGASFGPEYHSRLGVAIRIYLPPYPYDRADPTDRGRPIILPEGVNKKEDSSFYLLTDAYRDDKIENEEVYLWAASDGVVGKIVTSGDDLEEVLEEVHEMVSKVQSLDLGYRIDVGMRVFDDIRGLQNFGVL